jgi:hypothetical protein
MPIPQFHRTPKTRKRRTRRAPPVQERFDVEEMDAEHTTVEEVPSVPQAMELDESCALLQRDSANDEVATAPDEVPALLSSWPPRRQ